MKSTSRGGGSNDLASLFIINKEAKTLEAPLSLVHYNSDSSEK